MKTILLWDPRFPDRRPARLTVEDSVASAAVRAGVAAAANPAEAGSLSAGVALDPGMLTEVALQHGSGSAIRRVFVPYSVALVGATAGVLAAVGTPIAGGVVLPTLTLTGPLTYSTTSPSGTLVANIGNVPAGVTPTLTPNDGRLVIAGSAGAWTVVTGLAASTAGTITLAVAAAGANGTSAGVTIAAAGRVLFAAFGGSSTMDKRNIEGTATTVDSATRSTSGYTYAAAGTTGLGLLTFAKIISDRTGLTSKHFTKAQSGTSLDTDWLTSATLRNALTTGVRVTPGPADLLIFNAGFNTWYQGRFVNEATHLDRLNQFAAAVRSETTFANQKIGIFLTQPYTGGAGATGTDAELTALRSAEMTWAQGTNNYLIGSLLDKAQVDGIHMTNAAIPLFEAQIAENFMAIAGVGGAVLEQGPRAVSAVAVYTTKTRVTLQHSTGADFTPTTGITGFTVSFDNGVTLLPATGIRIDATTVELTHAASGGVAPRVFAYAGMAPNITGYLRDTSPRAWPMRPTFSAGILAPAGTNTVDPATPVPGARVLNDTFTAADGTNLTARPADTGQTWSVSTGSYLIAGNLLYGAIPGQALSSLAPSGKSYSVFDTIVWRGGSSPTGFGAHEFLFGHATDSNNRLQGGWLASESLWQVGDTSGGTYTFRAKGPAVTLVSGQVYNRELQFIGNGDNTTTVILFIDSVEQCRYTTSLFPNAGSVGTRHSGTNSTATTGPGTDNFGVVMAA